MFVSKLSEQSSCQVWLDFKLYFRLGFLVDKNSFIGFLMIFYDKKKKLLLFLHYQPKFLLLELAISLKTEKTKPFFVATDDSPPLFYQFSSFQKSIWGKLHFHIGFLQKYVWLPLTDCGRTNQRKQDWRDPSALFYIPQHLFSEFS